MVFSSAQRSVTVWSAALLAAVLLVGCDQSKTTGGSSSDLNRTLGDSEWAIVLDMLVGQGHHQFAEQRVRELATQTGLPGFWSVNEGTRSMVYFGRYDSPTTAEARNDLAKMRNLADSGRITASTVNLVPVRQPLSGDINAHDLRAVQTPGAVYTLQVGYYDQQFGPDFRQAAEKAVDVYREDGAEAYFYHGPNRSLVTIGIFGRAAAKIDNTGSNKGRIVYHPYIVELQTKHPYNLGNGLTLLVKNPATGKKREQPSFLVRIPK
jgi:hypothetical protein